MERMNKQTLATELIKKGYTVKWVEEVTEAVTSYNLSYIATNKVVKHIDSLGGVMLVVKEVDVSALNDWSKSVLLDILAEKGEEEMRKYFTLLLKYAEQESENE